MLDKDVIIEKIKKLIALSEDQGATEHEKAAAYKRAQHLMLKYSIDSLIDDAEPEIIRWEFKLDKVPFGLDRYKICQILSTIGPAFGCYSYFMRSGLGEIYLMGFKVNCEIVDYTAKVLIAQGLRDCLSAWNANPSAGFKISFWNGFIDGLITRYGSSDFQSKTEDLVVYDKVKQLFQSNVKIVGVTNYGNLQDAKKAGSKSAQEAQINKGLYNQSGGRKELK